MSTQRHPRQPAGTPVGGQFATTPNVEATVDLTADTAATTALTALVEDGHLTQDVATAALIDLGSVTIFTADADGDTKYLVEQVTDLAWDITEDVSTQIASEAGHVLGADFMSNAETGEPDAWELELDTGEVLRWGVDTSRTGDAVPCVVYGVCELNKTDEDKHFMGRYGAESSSGGWSGGPITSLDRTDADADSLIEHLRSFQ